MGLELDRKSGRFAILRRISCWWLPVILIVSSGIFELLGEGGRTWLQYDREAIANLEMWRLLTGQLVHFGLGHYALNALGLILVWLLVGMQFSTGQWLIVTAVSIAGVDIGLWVLNPQIIWYVGMSGFLHGMLVAGVVKGFRTAPSETLIMGLVVLLKIVYEQLIGPMPGSEQSAGGSVLVDAHLYGALAGAGIAAILWGSKLSNRRK
jgi:rhomboid family GlyGly-CTERM serine protease